MKPLENYLNTLPEYDPKCFPVKPVSSSHSPGKSGYRELRKPLALILRDGFHGGY